MILRSQDFLERTNPQLILKYLKFSHRFSKICSFFFWNVYTKLYTANTNVSCYRFKMRRQLEIWAKKQNCICKNQQRQQCFFLTQLQKEENKAATTTKLFLKLNISSRTHTCMYVPDAIIISRSIYERIMHASWSV